MQLPTGACGRSSHSWWAVIILIAVDMTVFASFVFSHLHVSMAADVCPPAGASLPASPWPVAAGILLMTGSLAMVLATRALRSAASQQQRPLRLLVLFALACTAGGIGADIASQIGAGLDPTARATLDNTALMWHCVTAQGVIAMLAVHLMPRLT